MESCKGDDFDQGDYHSKPLQMSLNCKKTAIFSKGYLKTSFRVPRLTTLQHALKKWLTSVRRDKGMDKEQSCLGTESCIHRSGFITPVEERRMVCILQIDQRGYKNSTHQKWEEYPLGLFSLTLRLHSSGIESPVEETRMNFIRISLLNGKRGKSNKRENNPIRMRFPLSLFLVSESSTEKSSSYHREGTHQEENWHQSEYYGK